MDFLDELQSRVLPGDGAPGPLLRARGFAGSGCIEELCASNAEAVRQVHADFLLAGARVLRTNSFAGNAVQLARHGCEHRVGELNWLAAQLAVQATKGSGAHIAACVGPLGGGPMSAAERRGLFEEQMGALLDGGARLVLFEAFTDLDELLAAIEAKHTLHHCPVIATVCGDLAGDPSLDAAFARLRAADADVVGLSDRAVPDTMQTLAARAEGSVAVFHGSGGPPADYATVSRALAEAGVSLIGGRAGIAPEHVAAFVDALALSAK